MWKGVAKQIIKKPFHLFGLDLVHRHPPESDPEPELPPLFDHPFEALCSQQGGGSAAFRCPLKYTVTRNALSFSPGGWHPFVAALCEYAVGESTEYEDSVLRRYYEAHQPDHAGAAVVGFEQFPETYTNHPPHIYRLTPWSSGTADTVDQNVRDWTQHDDQKYGDSGREWKLSSDGFQYHGPVSPQKGQLEYRRLVNVYESIKAGGYNRSQGHAHFLVLRRGKEYRFLNKGQGNHRTAAMTALGYDTIPAKFYNRYVLDLEMAEYWPQVRRGVWKKEQAEAYFNHLFDFDSRAWAEERGLLRKQQYAD